MFAIYRELLGCRSIGITFDGHFGAESSRNRVENPYELRWVDERRSSATKKHTRCGGKWVERKCVRDLSYTRVDVLSDKVLAICPCRKIAVITSRRTERDVDVHAETVGCAMQTDGAIVARSNVEPLTQATYVVRPRRKPHASILRRHHERSPLRSATSSGNRPDCDWRCGGGRARRVFDADRYCARGSNELEACVRNVTA